MSKDIVPQPNWKDVIHSAAKGIISLVPFGGVIGEMYGYLLVAPYTKRMEEFLNKFAIKVEQLEQKQALDLDSVLKREKVKTTIAQAYLIWMRNHQAPKKEALLNAILNSMISDDADEDLELMFLNYIDVFTSSHLEMLEFLYNNEIERKGGNWSTSLDAKIHKAAISVNPKFADISFFKMILKDLVERQLIDRMSKNVPEETYLGSVVTKMGEYFLNYIKFPN